MKSVYLVLVCSFVFMIAFFCPTAEGGAISGSSSSMLEYVTQEERQSAKEYVEICRRRPRYSYFSTNFNWTKQEARLLLYDTPEDLLKGGNYMVYGESILLMMAPVVVIVVLFIPGAIIFYLFRCCTCGTYHPTRGVCAGERMKDKWVDGVDGYKTDCVVGFQVAACLAAVVVVVGALVVIFGNRSVSVNFDHAVTYVNVTIKDLVKLLNDTLDVAANLTGDLTDMFDASSFLNSLESARNIGVKLEGYDDLALEYYPMVSKPRHYVLLGLMILPCVAVLFLLLGVFIGPQPLTCTSIVLSCVSLPLCFLLFALHYPLGTALSDTCYFLDSATDVNSPDYFSYLASFYECSNSSPIGRISGILDGLVSTVDRVICNNIAAVCNRSAPCDNSFDGEVLYDDIEDQSKYCMMTECEVDPSTCTGDTIDNIFDNIMVYNYKINCYDITDECPSSTNSSDLTVCGIRNDEQEVKDFNSCSTDKITIHGHETEYPKQVPIFSGYVDPEKPKVKMEECVNSCTLDEMKAAARVIVAFKQSVLAIMDVIRRIQAQLMCSTIVGIVQNIQDFACVKVINSLRPLTSGSLTVAIGLYAVIVIATFGAKRFDRKYRFKIAPMVEEDDNNVELEEEVEREVERDLRRTYVNYEEEIVIYSDEEGDEIIIVG